MTIMTTLDLFESFIKPVGFRYALVLWIFLTAGCNFPNALGCGKRTPVGVVCWYRALDA